MKNITFSLFFVLCWGTVLFGQVTTQPDPPVANDSVTLYFDKTGTGLANYSGTIYAHIGVTVNGQDWQHVVGTWGDNVAQPALTHVSGTTYSLTLGPTLYDYFGVDTTQTINAIDVVFRSADGNQQTSPDIIISVGAFQWVTTTPTDGATVTVTPGQALTISAKTTQKANWTLRANGTVVNTVSQNTDYNFQYPINQVTNFELTASRSGSQPLKIAFVAIPTPSVVTQAIPVGIQQGINYGVDSTKVTLALYAPEKDYVHVIGSFNNWKLSNDYLMKRDSANPDLYWLTIDSLTPEKIYTFQYRTSDGIKIADPYSTLVLSPWDDPSITPQMYPNLPPYPAGQEFEVSVVQTNQPSYNWQVTRFDRPPKENLIIYELLIRDFSSGKTWDDLIQNFDYFKNLHINAIEVMPVMEFEGNSSWGYNTDFHLALDKAYGTKNSMKAFIDLCHQNGIAVILDVALNHVYGRSPLVRMWMDDPDGDGFGKPTANNPYCNVEAKHAYSVGYDLNHQSPATQYYVKRVITYWMTTFHIDGFRWDLTKGFTNNCSPSDEACTNAYQADRVAILKKYADEQWAIDPDFYVIFEHLGVGGSHQEEIEWANYRVNEGKGIMLWNKWTGALNQNTMGYPENSNFDGIDFENQGYERPRNIAYAESHDEERLMYKNEQYGNASGAYSVKDVATALQRQKALGAILFTIPGPKMIWQFGELGYDYSINQCQDGTVNNSCRTDPKPIPEEIGYTTNPDRMEVYNTWAKIIKLRLSNEVFKTNTFSVETGNLLPRIYIWDDNIPVSELKNVVVFANFTTTSQTITPYFPFTGTWYNLLDSSTLNVTATDSSFTVTLNPGEFRIYGNHQATLSVPEVSKKDRAIKLYPNPVQGQLYFVQDVHNLQIYDLTGRSVKIVHEVRANYPINVSGLSRGMYIVKGSLQNGRLFSVKFIKR